MSEEIKQGTDAWKAARLRKPRRSRIADAVARIKTGYGASRANLMAELIAERLTGVPRTHSAAPPCCMGTETEPQARAAFAFLRTSSGGSRHSPASTIAGHARRRTACSATTA